MGPSRETSPQNVVVRTPWWLAGDHSCDHCRQSYCIEIAYYCTACDAPVCPECIVVIKETLEHCCPSCGD